MKLNTNVKTSISGIRGRYPDELTLSDAVKLALAFAQIIDANNGQFVIGHDARLGSIEIYQYILPVLQTKNIKLIDIGLVPLPTTGIAIKHFHAVGGVCLTASHNPHPWHGLKMLNSDGEFIDSVVLDQVIHDFEKIEVDLTGVKPTYSDNYRESAMTTHLDLYPKSDYGLVIALDCVNNAGSLILPRLVEQLGCIPINLACDPNKPAWREYEPNTQTLKWTTQAISKLNHPIDFGIAVDPDADRLVLLTDQGVVINEELTLALSIWNMLECGYQGPIVVNLSTSNVIDYVARKYDRKVIRTAVGEQNVVNGMKSIEAVIGGEGNGGVIDGTRHYSRDSLSALFHVASLINKTGKTLVHLIDELPILYMIKDKMTVPSDFDIKNLINTFDGEDAVIDQQDGLRFDFPDKSWVQVRLSNTEPIIRIFAESVHEDKAQDLLNTIKSSCSQ